MCERTRLDASDPRHLSLRGRIAFLVRDTAVYGLSGAVSRVASLFTFPIIARSLTVTDYGLLDLMQVVTAFLVIIFVFGQDSAVVRFFFDNHDAAPRRQIVSQSFFFLLAVSLAFTLALWLSSDALARVLSDAEGAGLLVRVLLLQVPFLAMMNFAVSLLRTTFSRRRYLILTLGYSASQATLWLLAVLVFDAGVFGVLAAGALAAAVFGLLGVFFVRDWIVAPRGLAVLRQMLPYALPFALVGCVEALAPILQRWLTQSMFGPEDLGVFAVGAKVASLASLVVFAFQAAWTPFALSLHKQADAADTYRLVLKILTLGVCLMAMALSALATPLISLLASSRYAAAAVLVFPLTIAIGINALGWVTEVGLSIAKRSSMKLLASCVGLLVMVGAILALGQVFGIVGVALGVLAGTFVKVVLLSFLSHRSVPVGWGPEPLVLLAVALAIGLAGTLAESARGPLFATMVHLGAILSVAVVGPAILFSRDERRAVFRLLRLA